MSLKRDFGDDFAGTAFGEVAGDPAIIGKWGSIVELDDATYDVWFHDTGNPGGALGERKLAAIARKCPDSARLTRLDGEAYAQGEGRAFVVEMAALAGVRRKRRMSPEARAAAAERLQKAAQARKSP